MRKLLLTTAVSTLSLAALPLATVQAADTYNIDTDHTYAHFAIDHLGLSTVVGRIHSSGGTLTVDTASNTGMVQVDLDPATIDTGHERRDDHLRSPDFLNVLEFPEMRFESTAVTLAEDGGTVEGTLTIAGQTRPVTLSITRWTCTEHPMAGKPACGFDANGTLQRSEFGINYGIPNIGDELQLMINVEAIQEG
jgi:polyisoprenoid-binding protein YceI